MNAYGRAAVSTCVRFRHSITEYTAPTIDGQHRRATPMDNDAGGAKRNSNRQKGQQVRSLKKKNTQLGKKKR